MDFPLDDSLCFPCRRRRASQPSRPRHDCEFNLNRVDKRDKIQSMKLNLALAQINTRLGNVDANLEKHLDIARQAKQEGADLVLFLADPVAEAANAEEIGDVAGGDDAALDEVIDVGAVNGAEGLGAPAARGARIVRCSPSDNRCSALQSLDDR